MFLNAAAACIDEVLVSVVDNGFGVLGISLGPMTDAAAPPSMATGTVLTMGSGLP